MLFFNQEKIFSLLLILFIVGVAFSVYYQNSPFITEEEEVMRIVENQEEDISEAEVHLKTTADRSQVEEVGRDFFVDYRMEREKIRSRQIDLLTEIINNQYTDDQVKNRAHDTLMQLTESIEKEMEIESRIQAKGFTDALVFITDKKVDVVVRSDEFHQEKAEMVGDIIGRSTGIPMANIAVIHFTD